MKSAKGCAITSESWGISMERLISTYEQVNQNGVMTNGEVKSLVKNSKIFRAVQITKYHTKVYSYSCIKRLVDICAGLVGSIILLPIMAIVKIAYLKDGDHAPILFKQKRIGKNGKTIEIYKIRSMVPDADKVLKKLLKEEKYKAEWSKNQKFENDPRITKIGKLLRKTSIDEIPQFINVLKGEMSLIGPRPLVAGELDEHSGNHKIYERIRPGISGWWAANGRSATTYEKRLELEYFYCMNCSLLLDLKCIFLTISAVVFKRGAK